MVRARVLLIETPTFSHFVQQAAQHVLHGVDFIGVANTVENALELISVHQPDVLLVDLRGESLSGFASLNSILDKYPQALVVGRVDTQDYKFILEAIAAGVTGFINDQVSFHELCKAVHTVRQGYPFLPQNIEYRFVQELQRKYATTL